MRLWEIFMEVDALNEEGKIIPNVNTTVDVQPGETQRQAAKFGFGLDQESCPPTHRKDAVHSTGMKNSIIINDPLYGRDGTRLKENTELEEFITHNGDMGGWYDDSNIEDIRKHINNGKTKKIGTFNDADVLLVKDGVRFGHIFKDKFNNPIGYIKTFGNTKLPGNPIASAWVHPVHRGRGIGYAMYKWMIEHYGYLFSDALITPDAQRLWSKLIRDYKVTMWSEKSGEQIDAERIYDIKVASGNQDIVLKAEAF